MYILIPNVFFVPIYYVEKDMLDIRKIVILQFGNSNSNFSNETTKSKDPVIGISFPTQREEKWVKDKDVIEKYANLLGDIVKIESADNDAGKQASQVEQLISQGIDVLILAPVDSLAAADMVEKAHKAGIPVIAYERIIKDSDLDLYISFNGTRIGELQGRFIIDKVPKGNYIILSGDPKDENSKLLKEGAMDYIKPLVARRDIKIVTDKAVDNWDPQIAYEIVKDSLIANNNKIDAILAPNDAIAGAAIQALEEQGLAGKVIVTGQNAELPAAQRIVQGTQSMTIFKDTRELGKAAIDFARKLANKQAIDIHGTVNNGKIDVPSIFITPIVVDKNNIDKVLIDSGYLKKEQIYKR